MSIQTNCDEFITVAMATADELNEATLESAFYAGVSSALDQIITDKNTSQVQQILRLWYADLRVMQ